MPAKDLGTKYVCFKCQTKFYDLKKPEPRCPKCQADQRESPVLKAPEKTERRRRTPAPVVAKPSIEEESFEDEGLDDEDEDLAADDDDI